MITYENLVNTVKNRIPIFSDKYDEMIQKDIIDKESGNHIVFGYAFTPLMVDIIKKGDKENIELFFSILEEMSSSTDKRVTEVCDQSVIEALYDEFGDDIDKYMGEKTKEGLIAVKEYFY